MAARCGHPVDRIGENSERAPPDLPDALPVRVAVSIRTAETALWSGNGGRTGARRRFEPPIVVRFGIGGAAQAMTAVRNAG